MLFPGGRNVCNIPAQHNTNTCHYELTSSIVPNICHCSHTMAIQVNFCCQTGRTQHRHILPGRAGASGVLRRRAPGEAEIHSAATRRPAQKGANPPPSLRPRGRWFLRTNHGSGKGAREGPGVNGRLRFIAVLPR